MTQRQPPKLPLGNADFATLRQSGAIYVDKTAHIQDLVKGQSNAVFIARPRRFGKSLLLSTLYSLFKFGLRDFDGLKIADHWDEPVYRTARLDLSGAAYFNTIDEFRVAFHSQLRIAFGQIGFDDDRTTDTETQLFGWLQKQPPESLVLLIDEYDAPLTNALDRLELLKAVREHLQCFYENLQKTLHVFRFLFVTGVTHAGSSGVLSSFSSLLDITYEPRYATLIGFTEEELENHFSDYISIAATRLKLKPSALIDRLHVYYGGYAFGGQALTNLYCPWSILCYFDNDQCIFESYWFRTGGQAAILKTFVTNNPITFIKSFIHARSVLKKDIINPGLYENLSLEAILTQAGYLTVSPDDASHFKLTYPNCDISLSMAQLYTQSLLKSGCRLIEPGGFSPKQIFLTQNAEAVIQLLNRYLDALDVHKASVTNEADLCATLQVLLIATMQTQEVELHNTPDGTLLVVKVAHHRWVIAFKSNPEKKMTNDRLRKATPYLESVAKDQTHHNESLHCLVVFFDKSEHHIMAWNALDFHSKSPFKDVNTL